MNTLKNQLTNDQLYDLLEENWGDWIEVFKIIEKYNLDIDLSNRYICRNSPEVAYIYYLGDYSDEFIGLLCDYFEYWCERKETHSIEQSGFIDLRC